MNIPDSTAKAVCEPLAANGNAAACQNASSWRFSRPVTGAGTFWKAHCGVIVAILAGFVLWEVVGFLYDAVRFPLDLALETPALRAVEDLRMGISPYGRDPDGQALRLVLYPPLYFEVAALFPAFEGAPFLALRLVALVSGVALLCLPLLFSEIRRRAPAYLILLLVFLINEGMALQLVHAKPDIFPVFVSVAGFLACLHWRDSRLIMLIFPLMALLGAWSKQSHIAAPAAFLIWLAVQKRFRRAMLLAVLAIVAASLGLAYGSWAYGPGFISSLINVTEHSWTATRMVSILAALWENPGLLGLLAGGLTLLALRPALMRSPWGLYFAVSFGLHLLLSGKEGSDVNYLVEPAIAVILLLTIEGPDASRDRRFLPAAVVMLVVGVGVWKSSWKVSPGHRVVRARIHETFEEVLVRSAVSRDASILYLGSPNLVGPSRLTEPDDAYLHLHRWNLAPERSAPTIERVARREFGAIVTKAFFLEGLAPAVAPKFQRTIGENYHPVLAINLYVLWVPREGPPEALPANLPPGHP